MRAAEEGHTNLVKRLLDIGIDKNLRDINGSNALKRVKNRLNSYNHEYAEIINLLR